jgi:hypothetical protein
VKRRRWPVVEIVWHDAHGDADGAWGDAGSMPTKPVEIRTVGMLARESKTGVVVVLSLDRTNDKASGYIFIPHSGIVGDITYIERGNP